MAEAKYTKNQDEENFGATEDQELDNILDQLSEVEHKKANLQQRATEETQDIIQKPAGSAEQPDDIEGLLEKISEKPETRIETPDSQTGRKAGFFQRILNFFKG